MVPANSLITNSLIEDIVCYVNIITMHLWIFINIDIQIAMESHYVIMVSWFYMHIPFISLLQTMAYTSTNKLMATSHKIT